jgi:hypothetical protein
MPPASYLRLQNALQTVHETEEIGRDTLVILQTQCAALERTKQNARQTSEEIGVARRFLNRMTARIGLCGIFKTC